MSKSKLVVVIICMSLILLGTVYVIRPFNSTLSQGSASDSPLSSPAGPAAPRGTQFFEAHVDEARRVAAACRDGTIRGDECANAETAIITVGSKERFKRFRTEQ
jgi:hypothetical protein